MKGIIVGALLGAVLMFMWGFLFWGVLPVGATAISGVEDQAGLQAELAKRIPQSGVYMLPYAQDQSDAEYQALHAKGPIVTIHYRAEGSEPMSPGTFAMGYFHEFIVLLIMGLMLKMAAVASFGARFVVVFMGGIAGSVFSTFSGPIWWLNPWSMAWTNTIYEVVAWLLAAVVLAALVKPAGRASPHEV